MRNAKFSRRFIPAALACFASLAAAAVVPLSLAAAADEAPLTSDSMRYDPGNGRVYANGRVHITHPDGEIFGDAGSGAADASFFEIHGNVRGHFSDKSGRVVKLACREAQVKGKDPKSRVVTASGDVRLTRGKEWLNAAVIVWRPASDRYSAHGGVKGETDGYAIDSDTASRDMDAFAATGVRRFYASERKFTLASDHARGRLKGREITEVTASGNVVMSAPDKDGNMTRATGDSAVYSVARGTIVLSGGSSVIQRGRELRSESVVYYLDTGRVNAQGRPSLTFETGTDERRKKSGGKK
jgi:lipopolysaccharide transport protein LptA